MSYLAESYERFMVPGLFAPWSSNLIQRANPQPGERVLDIACGKGIVARNVAPRVGSQGKEMHRVLRPGGRAILSVWQGLDRHPFYQTLHHVSLRHLGKSSVQSVYSLGDPDELGQLLASAGFQQVEIEPASITARFPNAEEFLAWEIDVDPAETPALQNLDTGAQQAILAAVRQDMQGPLEEIMQDNQVVLQFHAHVAQARR